ncbi:MAG: VCBS repeat-containing protein, partial [Chthoniobacterales bacterium]|nr:VCBS repeat-containing protein [Chthoniobacterales bacterium]
MRTPVASFGLLLLGLTCVAAPAQNIFTDVTTQTLGTVPHTGATLPGIRIGTGAAWFDYDRDGDLDLYMTNRVGSNHLWRNDGGGVFVEVT